LKVSTSKPHHDALWQAPTSIVHDFENYAVVANTKAMFGRAGEQFGERERIGCEA
jgi:hypothetical protein